MEPDGSELGVPFTTIVFGALVICIGLGLFRFTSFFCLGRFEVISINRSRNSLLTCCSLTCGVMAMRALYSAETRVIRPPDIP